MCEILLKKKRRLISCIYPSAKYQLSGSNPSLTDKLQNHSNLLNETKLKLFIFYLFKFSNFSQNPPISWTPTNGSGAKCPGASIVRLLMLSTRLFPLSLLLMSIFRTLVFCHIVAFLTWWINYYGVTREKHRIFTYSTLNK